jgi:hypothetical protein
VKQASWPRRGDWSSVAPSAAKLAGACNSNPGNAQADLTVPVTAGTTYRVRISHFRTDVDPAATTTTSFPLQ